MRVRYLKTAALVVVVLIAMAVPAFAEDTALVEALGQVAADTTQPVKVRAEAVRTLKALGAQEEALYVSLAGGKSEDGELRRTAIDATGVLTTTSDSVKAMLRAIAADTTDAEQVRITAVMRIGATGIDAAGARAVLSTMLGNSADATLVRTSVVKAIATDPGTGGIGALVSVLNTSGEDARVRIAIVDALKDGKDAGFIAAIRNMIAATAATDEKDTRPGLFTLDDKQIRLALRCRAVLVGRDNLINTDILSAIKIAAADKNDNAVLRGSAIGALGAVASQQDVESLLAGILADETDLTDIRACALNALSGNVSTASAAALVAILSDASESLQIRIAAADAIVKHLPGVKPVGFGVAASAAAWQETAVPANAISTIVASASEDPELRRIVVSRLKGVTETAVLAALRVLVADKTEAEAIRLAAISVLRGDSGSVTILQATAADETDADAVRQAAGRAAVTE